MYEHSELMLFIRPRTQTAALTFSYGPSSYPVNHTYSHSLTHLSHTIHTTPLSRPPTMTSIYELVFLPHNPDRYYCSSLFTSVHRPVPCPNGITSAPSYTTASSSIVVTQPSSRKEEREDSSLSSRTLKLSVSALLSPPTDVFFESISDTATHADNNDVVMKPNDDEDVSGTTSVVWREDDVSHPPSIFDWDWKIVVKVKHYADKVEHARLCGMHEADIDMVVPSIWEYMQDNQYLPMPRSVKENIARVTREWQCKQTETFDAAVSRARQDFHNLRKSMAPSATKPYHIARSHQPRSTAEAKRRRQRMRIRWDHGNHLLHAIEESISTPDWARHHLQKEKALRLGVEAALDGFDLRCVGTWRVGVQECPELFDDAFRNLVEKLFPMIDNRYSVNGNAWLAYKEECCRKLGIPMDGDVGEQGEDVTDDDVPDVIDAAAQLTSLAQVAARS